MKPRPRRDSNAGRSLAPEPEEFLNRVVIHADWGRPEQNQRRRGPNLKEEVGSGVVETIPAKAEDFYGEITDQERRVYSLTCDCRVCRARASVD